MRKAYDTVKRNRLRKKCWETEIRGELWRMVKMAEYAKGFVVLDGEVSDYSDVSQGVAQLRYHPLYLSSYS